MLYKWIRLLPMSYNQESEYHGRAPDNLVIAALHSKPCLSFIRPKNLRDLS
jgi:hypothetical protein